MFSIINLLFFPLFACFLLSLHANKEFLIYLNSFPIRLPTLSSHVDSFALWVSAHFSSQICCHRTLPTNFLNASRSSDFSLSIPKSKRFISCSCSLRLLPSCTFSVSGYMTWNPLELSSHIPHLLHHKTVTIMPESRWTNVTKHFFPKELKVLAISYYSQIIKDLTHFLGLASIVE